MVQPSDEELMRLLQKGDSTAFNLLYERHSDKVWSYIRKRLPREVAEDLFQDCFVKLVEKRDKWRNQPFIFWFYVIIRNLVTDYYRSNRVEKKYLNLIPSPEEPLLTSNDYQDIFQNLSPENKKLLTEFFEEGWSYRELATRYDLTEVSVRKRISRALSFLKGVKNE